MIIARIVFPVLSFMSVIVAATSHEEVNPQVIIEAIAAQPMANSHFETLESMRAKGEVFPKTFEELNAMHHAFWRNCCKRILAQEPLSINEGQPTYENILALIQDPSLSFRESCIADTDMVGELLNSAWEQFRDCCALLFPFADLGVAEESRSSDISPPESMSPITQLPAAYQSTPFLLLFSQDGLSSEGALSVPHAGLRAFIVRIIDENLPPASPGSAAEESHSLSDLESCVEWFNKILQTREWGSLQGSALLAGRLLQLSQYINDMSASDRPNNLVNVKRLISAHIIENSNNCPDRALSGLDEIEWEIQLARAPSIENAIHLMLRLYKKQIIREELVEHRFYESAEEYIYLLVLLNKHFNLGAVAINMESGLVGARKTFDTAASMLMEKLNVAGFVHFVAKNLSFRTYLLSISIHKDAMESAVIDPDTSEDAIYTYVREVISPIIYSTFTYEGEKFQQISSQNMQELLALSRRAAD